MTPKAKQGIGCFAVAAIFGIYAGPTTIKGYKDNGVSGNIDEGATYTEGSQVGI